MIIIPARLKSTRFENKILAKFGELPMFIQTAKNCQQVDEVFIACDDEKVLQIAKDFGFQAYLTSKEHKSGTDRINEVAQKLALAEDELIINVQADEPFFEVENLRKFKNFAQEALKTSFMASCYKIVSKEEAQDANLVKVVLDNAQQALYFSRSLLPYDRENSFSSYKAHLGLYAFTAKTLKEFCALPNSSLEDIEKLEQLRALENGKKISMLELSSSSFGIDTKEDYERALSYLKGQK